MANHGVFVSEVGTAVSTPIRVPTGIPFVVGRAPVQSAENPATVGVPVLCTSWDEAVERFGYSDDWASYTLCEVMDSHFKRYGMQPCIFVNVLDPVTMQETIGGDGDDDNSFNIYPVYDHRVLLGPRAILSSIEARDVELPQKPDIKLEKDTDYTVYYEDGNAYLELLSGSSSYDCTGLRVKFKAVKPDSAGKDAVAKGIEAVELCMNLLGVVPDMLLAPGFSEEADIAAALAAKAANINGLFRAKALVDIPTDPDKEGADVYNNVLEVKNKKGYTDLNMIACWPMVSLSGKVYHMSTHLAGVIAATDAQYEAPYGSPSNHTMHIDGLVTSKGNEVLLSLAQANMLNNNGVMTALNFMGGFTAWGNYTACYPDNTDVKDYFISVSRMFDWVANTLIVTFWSRLDIPMTRRMVDSVVDTANIWLNGLTGSGYILGGRVELIDSENPVSNLMQGIVKFHIYMTPPSPAQEIDISLEYDVSYLEAAFAAAE